MVRLKAGANSNDQAKKCLFQFLMVRLKVNRVLFADKEDCNFNSLWFD